MDQDFYIEENSPVKIVLSIILFIGVIAGGLYFFLEQRTKINIKLKNVTVELGEKLSTNNSTYLIGDNINSYSIDLSRISIDEEGNTNSAGEYSYYVKINGEYKKAKIYVKDTIKPEVEVEDLTVGLNEEFMPNDFIKSCTDKSLPCTARYKNIKNEELNSKEGTYNVDIIISDNAGNEVTKNAKLTVSSKETLLAKKESDLTFDHLSEEDSNWNNTYTVKLEKALADESARFNEAMEDISTKEFDLDKEIKDKTILVAYNQYNYAIGFTVKITFADDSVKYLTSSDEKNEE